MDRIQGRWRAIRAVEVGDHNDVRNRVVDARPTANRILLAFPRYLHPKVDISWFASTLVIAKGGTRHDIGVWGRAGDGKNTNTRQDQEGERIGFWHPYYCSAGGGERRVSDIIR